MKLSFTNRKGKKGGGGRTKEKKRMKIAAIFDDGWPIVENFKIKEDGD